MFAWYFIDFTRVNSAYGFTTITKDFHALPLPENLKTNFDASISAPAFNLEY